MRTRHATQRITATLLALTALLAPGCQATKTPVANSTLTSPYAQRVVIAVAPAHNHSGVSSVDGAAFADHIVAQLQATPGIAVLPVNRTLDAMASLEMRAVATPHDASILARALDADAVIVPALNAWDPYEPLQLGVSGVLFAHSDAVRAPSPSTIDPNLIQAAWSDESFVYSARNTSPVSAASYHFDGAAGNVQWEVQQYAAGRHDPDTALGWQRYLKSMNEFEKFAAYALVRSLLAQEQRRIDAVAAAPEPPLRQAEVHETR